MRESKYSTASSDADRIIELKRRIWGRVAEALLYGRKDPKAITNKKIEEHRGRRDKALRLLKPYLTYVDKEAPKYGDTIVNYKVERFEEESAAVAEAPTFIDTWQAFHDEIYSFNHNDQQSFDDIGYLEVSTLSPANILYIYWHQEEFNFSKGEDKCMVFPAAKYEHRIKCMLRGIIEHTHQDGFATKLEKYLGIPYESLKRDDALSFRVRNFCAKAADLTEERYFGKNGFRDEYAHYRDYFEALLYNLKRLDDLVKAKGGQAAVTREMRKATMTELLEEAPLRIDYKEDPENASAFMRRYRRDDNETLKYISVFILRNSSHFDYDTLYAADESIDYIEEYHAVMYREGDRYSFTPAEDEVAVINAATKERTACSAKKTSEILRSI
jgi:hypothetical protein